MPSRREDPRRTIASYTSPRCFEPHTRAALRGSGYNIVPAAIRGRFDDDSWRPELRIVDEQNMHRLPSRAADPRTPIIVTLGARPLDREDPRIVGRLRRPIGLVPLFRLLQKTLEPHPRRVPRVPTQLAARCIQSDRRWTGAVVSLSEMGCLLHSGQAPEIGSKLNLQFAIPALGLIATRARCVSHCSEGVGLTFNPPPMDMVGGIGAFVTQRLATL